MSNIFSLSGEFLGTSQTINRKARRDRVRRLRLIPNENLIALNPQLPELKPIFPELTELQITLEVVPMLCEIV